MIRKIFYEIVSEAKNKKIVIDDEEYPIAFDTIISSNSGVNKYQNDNICTLEINNEEDFFSALEEYVNLELSKKRKTISFLRNQDKNNIKLIISYLFVNATTGDFKNPIGLIKRNISFLKDSTFSSLNDGISIGFDNENSIVIKNSSQGVLMETPNKFEFSITDGKNIYKLPTISYGIVDEFGIKTCYVYSILNKNMSLNNESEEKYHKKISRMLYKINKGIIEKESDEYLEYKEKNSDYYPENVSDVSPSAVLSLTIFMSILKNRGINDVKAVPFLPLRYISRAIAADNTNDIEKKNRLIERNYKIESNVVEKFIRTFRRLEAVSGIHITSMPYELDEFLSLNLNNYNKEVETDFLNNISRKI